MEYFPLVSVIIVAWNSKAYLHTCLNKLLAQTFNDFEVILVDNGSEDDAVGGLQEKFPSLALRIEKLGSNRGFSIANNIGARLASGQWLALLNADAFPEPDWLEQLMHATENNPEFTFFTSRQIQANARDMLDGTGDVYHVSGLAWRENYNQLVSENGLKSKEAFSACAAAALYSRNDFLKVGGFDEDYFSYFEDVDLSFRMRLVGGRCLYVPQAVVYHVGSASSGKKSDFVVYYGHRNLEFTYFKNMPALLLWFYFPVHILMNFIFTFYFLLEGKGIVFLKAKAHVLCCIPNILRKRRQVQGMRTVSIKEIHDIMSKGLLSPYWASSRRRSSLNGKNI